ncbi:MAG TPA: cohesin domain-containing protein, partial [Geomobilimonas sp.]|nr:cohesin domain-containing protein [Geomobilimonas sp.]
KYSVSLNTLTPEGGWLSETFNPATTTTTTTGSTTTTSTTTTPKELLNVFNWRGFGGFITVPSATFNFGKSLANGESLANPKLRVKNREKAKFNVGTRVPITTTSSPTGGGVSVNVQYVDVGVKLNAEPTIQLNNDVIIKLSLEVSSILSRDKVGDAASLTTVVTISTRNLDTVLNLKDGETSIIGGLIQDSKSTSKKKIWLLGDIPILGSLLGSTDDTSDKTELVLAITPRLVRGVTIPDAEVSSFWSGREDDPVAAKLYSSFQESETDASPAGAVQPAGAQMPKGGTAPAPGKPMLPVPAPPGAQTMPVTPPIAPAAAPEPPQRIMLNLLAPPTVKVNDQFRVEIKVSDAKDLYNAPFTLVYDPLFLDFVGIEEGPFLKSDGKPTLFKTSLDANGGQVAVTLGRVGDVPGVTGAGTIVTAIFKAKNQGPASLGFLNANFVAAGGKPLETLPYNTAVEVQ